MLSATDPAKQEDAVQRTIADLSGEFSSRVERVIVAQIVQNTVSELRAHARIQTFIPVLAHRVARDRLLALAEGDGA